MVQTTSQVLLDFSDDTILYQKSAVFIKLLSFNNNHIPIVILRFLKHVKQIKNFLTSANINILELLKITT